MSRITFLSIAIFLSLLPAVAFTAPAHKRHLPHWHGYGFLPGYHQPPNVHVPVLGRRGAVRGSPYDAPQYFDWDSGEWHYFGDPGFFRGRYNGGSFGPCWTYTPIGLMWNCG